MYYKDKKGKKMMNSFNKLTAEFYNKKISSLSNRRLLIIVAIVLVIMFFAHNSPSSDVEIILDVNNMRLEKIDKNQPSIILDVLRKSNNANKEEESIPAFRLVTEFINGIYFYNIHEPIETWVNNHLII